MPASAAHVGGTPDPRLAAPIQVSEDVEALGQPVITRQQAAHAIVRYFLANAEAGNHAANDELIAELARHQREHRDQRDERRRFDG